MTALVIILAIYGVAQIALGIGTLCLLDRLIGEVDFANRTIVALLRLVRGDEPSAGIDAIMPLARGSNGLGVRAAAAECPACTQARQATAERSKTWAELQAEVAAVRQAAVAAPVGGAVELPPDFINPLKRGSHLSAPVYGADDGQ